MERYKSIYSEAASKAKLEYEKRSKKSLCYVVRNFVTVIPNSEMNIINSNDLQQFIFAGNGLACDVYFTENKSNSVTINILSGDMEFVKIIPNVDNWMKYKGDVWRGEGPDAQLSPSYSFDETKALKWFKDNFYNKGLIDSRTLDIGKPVKIGTHEYTINNVLNTPIRSVTPDVVKAETYFMNFRAANKLKSKSKSKKR